MNGVKTIGQAAPTFIPKLVPVGLLVLGLILGFIWAYGIAPSVYVSAEPVNLGASWKQEYVKQVAWQASASNDYANARIQLDALGNAADVLQETINANQGDANLLPKLEALQTNGAAVNNPAQMAKISPGITNSNVTPFMCIFGLAIVIGGLIILNSLVPFGALFSRKSSDPSTVVTGQEAERRKQVNAATQQKTDFVKAAPDRGKPVIQFMSTYLINDDVYDESKSIETEAGEFLGETGAGISKTLGAGTPKKVAAVEAWVFDKNDIKTVTKVLMSEYAYSDDAIRAELAPKGEAVIVRPGTVTTLETTTLTVQVRVVDVAYGTGNTPPNSYFDRLTLEMAAWPKKAPAGGIPDPYGGSTASFPTT